MRFRLSGDFQQLSKPCVNRTICGQYCQDTCENCGTCVVSARNVVTCSCPAGFFGYRCSVDRPFGEAKGISSAQVDASGLMLMGVIAGFVIVGLYIYKKRISKADQNKLCVPEEPSVRRETREKSLVEQYIYYLKFARIII